MHNNCGGKLLPTLCSSSTANTTPREGEKRNEPSKIGLSPAVSSIPVPENFSTPWSSPALSTSQVDSEEDNNQLNDNEEKVFQSTSSPSLRVDMATTEKESNEDDPVPNINVSFTIPWETNTPLTRTIPHAYLRADKSKLQHSFANRKETCVRAKRVAAQQQRAKIVPVPQDVGTHVMEVDGSLKHADTLATAEERKKQEQEFKRLESLKPDPRAVIFKNESFSCSYINPDQKTYTFVNQNMKLYNVKRYELNHELNKYFCNGLMSVMLYPGIIAYAKMIMSARYEQDRVKMYAVLKAAVTSAFADKNVDDVVTYNHVAYVPAYLMETYYDLCGVQRKEHITERKQAELLETVLKTQAVSSENAQVILDQAGLTGPFSRISALERILPLSDYITYGELLLQYSNTIPNTIFRWFVVWYFYILNTLRYINSKSWILIVSAILLLVSIVGVLGVAYYYSVAPIPTHEQGLIYNIFLNIKQPFDYYFDSVDYYYKHFSFVNEKITDWVYGEDNRYWWNKQFFTRVTLFDKLSNRVYNYKKSLFVFVITPACRLVGIELNPGPVEVSEDDDEPDLSRIISLEAGVDYNIKLKDDATLSVRNNQKVVPLREHAVIAGFHSGPYAPVVFPNTQNNQLSALMSRVLKETPKPDPLLIKEHNAFVNKDYDTLIGIYNVDPMPFDEYLASSNASVGVKIVLKNERTRLNSLGIDEYSLLTADVIQRATVRKSFVKTESLLYRSCLGLKNKSPRLIQGAEATFICLVGPWIAAVQKRFKKRWNLKNNVLFTSSHKSTDVADFISDCPPSFKIVEDDVSAWDSSVCEGLCKLELSICKRMGCPRATYALMKANIRTRGKTSNYRYTVKGTRKSGDPYTSMFNSLLNATTHLFIYKKSYNLGRYKNWRHCIKMVVQGDDNLLRYKCQGPIDWQGMMKQLGFKAQAIPRTSLTDAEFCSSIFVSDFLHNDFIPKTGKVLAKMCYFIDPPHVPIKGLIRGVAIANKITMCNNPIMQMVCDRLICLTDGAEAIHVKRFEWQMSYSGVIDLCTHLSERYFVNTEILNSMRETMATLQLCDNYGGIFESLLFDKETSGPQLIYGKLTEAKYHSLVPLIKDTQQKLITIDQDWISEYYSSNNKKQVMDVTTLKTDKSIKRPKPSKPVTSQESLNKRSFSQITSTGVNKIPVTYKLTKQKLNDDNKQSQLPQSTTTPPSSPLVGIELNPGPPKTIKKRIIKEAKKHDLIVKVKKAKPSLGRRGLRTAGSYLGNMVGFGDIGKSAGDWFADILGMGDYRVKSNMIAKGTGDVPVFQHSKDGSIIIDHTELVCDVKTSTDFTNLTWDINPGNKNLFPWLNFHAAGYEQYEFLGLVFIFKTTSANALNSTNAALGTHILSTEYDVSKPPFYTKQEMESYMFTVSTEPSKSVMHPVECNPKQDILNGRYVNSGVVSQTSAADVLSKNLSVLGTFQFASVGSQAAYTSGELHVSYKIKLYKPRAPVLGSLTYCTHFSNRYAATGNSSGTAAFTNMLQIPGQSTAPPERGNPVISVSGTNSIISFEGVAPGRIFLIQITHLDGGGNVTNGVFSYADIINNGYWFPTGTSSTSSIGAGGSGTSFISTSAYTRDANWNLPGIVTYSAPTTTAGTYYTDLLIVEIPNVGHTYSTLTLEQQVNNLQLRIAALTTVTTNEEEEEKEFDKPLDTSLYIPRSAVSKFLGR